MKYSVGFQLYSEGEEPFSEIAKTYREHISEVFFPWQDIATGRSAIATRHGFTDWTAQSRLEEELRKIKGMGIKLDLLFNGNCYGEYAISEKDLEKYILTGVETKDGYITLSNEVYVDPYTYKISKGTFLLNEYEKAYSNTEYKYIDKDNDMFTPETIDDTVYVPARFLNEEFGGETAWNDAERCAQFTLFGKTIKIYADSASAVVDGTDITLKNAPVISYSRLMLGFDDIETVFGIKTKMYDNDLMSFSKEALELTDGEAEKTAASIQVAIIK